MSKKETEQIKEEKIQTLAVENDAILATLTNKNREFFHQLDKQLAARDFSTDERTPILNGMLKKTVKLQADHVPARRYFGTAREQADRLARGEYFEDGKVQAEEVSPLWQRYIDGALLLGGFFAAINGMTAYGQDVALQTAGIGELIMNFLLGGLVMLVFNHYAPSRRDKKSLFRYTLASVGSMVVWILSIALIKGAALKWPWLNPQVPAWVVIAIGVLALVGKHFFKKHYEVTGTMF